MPLISASIDSNADRISDVFLDGMMIDEEDDCEDEVEDDNDEGKIQMMRRKKGK